MEASRCFQKSSQVKSYKSCTGIMTIECPEFWSRDYITGISALLGYINEDSDQLIRETKFYESFVNECCMPFLKKLEEMACNTSLVEHSTLSCLKEELQSKLGLEELRTKNLPLLQEACNDCKSLHSIMKTELLDQYSIYSERLKSAKAYMELYDRKSALPLADELDHQKFPIHLDATLKFANELELSTFIQKMKGSMPEQSNRFLPFFGGTEDNSFKGRQLLETIRKNYSKLDTSLYNMDRLGQNLLNSNIIKPFKIIVGSNDGKFDMTANYCWSDSNEMGGLTMWFQHLTNKQDTVDSYELSSMAANLVEKFYTLEYAKFELEKKIYESASRGLESHRSSLKLLTLLAEEFRAKHGSTAKITVKESQNIVQLVESGAIGYFTRDNALPYHIWVRDEDRHVLHTFMFGMEEIDDPTVETVRRMLGHIEDLKNDENSEEGQLESCWINGDIRDMKRSINLKLDLMNEFHLTGSNLAAVNKVIAGNRYNNAISDWVWLTKMWLLELQDGLIPRKHCRSIGKGEDWLQEIPANNFQLLRMLHSHLRGIDIGKFQIPLSHYLTRDCATLEGSKRLKSALNHMFEQASISPLTKMALPTQQEDCAESRDTTGVSSPQQRPSTPPTAPLPAAVSPIGSFIPKPFKTTSTS